MKYLVSCENNYYFSWQIELLIESFKKFNLQDDLIVAVANTKFFPKFGKNLVNHPHKFSFDNANIINPYLNKSYATFLAMQANLLGDNFVLIEPDMVLLNPIEPTKKNITFSIDSNFTQKLFEEEGYKKIIYNIKKSLANKEYITGYGWPYLGGVMQFNNVKIDFFQNVFLIGQEVEAINKQKRFTDKAAWITAFFEYLNVYNFEPNYNYEATMLEYELNKNFIHYSHGIPPVFNKRMYNSSQHSLFLTFDEPLKVLLEFNPTPITDYIQEIIHNYYK